MNNLLFSLMMGVCLNIGDTSCIEKFHFAATQDTALVGAPFVKYKVLDSMGNINTVLSPNYTLFAYFRNSQELSHKSYQELMISILNSDDQIDFLNYKMLPGHIVLTNDKYVERISRRGKKIFVRHFFERNVFKFKYQKHFETVVGKLFDYGVLVALGHNGSYTIIYDSDCVSFP